MTMITPSYLGETIEYSSLHACRSTLEDPTIRTGIWGYQPLLLILTITFFFAILYAVSALIAVMTRSSITCILLTIAAWFVFFLVGWGHGRLKLESAKEKVANVPQEQRMGDGAFAKVVKVIHNVMPRTEDLNRLNTMIVYCGYVTGDLGDLKSFNDADTVWWESLLVCGVWIALFLGVSCLWFSIKDY